MKIVLADFVGTASAEPELVSLSASVDSIKNKIASLSDKLGRMKERPQTEARKGRMAEVKGRIAELKAALKTADKGGKSKPAAKKTPAKKSAKKEKPAPKTTKGRSHKNPEFILDKKVDKANKAAMAHIVDAVGGENEIYFQRSYGSGPTGTQRSGQAPISPKKIAGLTKKLKAAGFKPVDNKDGRKSFQKDGVEVDIGDHYFKEDAADGSKLMTISMPMNKNPAWKSPPRKRSQRSYTLYD